MYSIPSTLAVLAEYKLYTEHRLALNSYPSDTKCIAFSNILLHLVNSAGTYSSEIGSDLSVQSYTLWKRPTAKINRQKTGQAGLMKMNGQPVV